MKTDLLMKKSQISLLLPEDKIEGGGLSGEVHLLKYKNKKYVLRKAQNLKQAKYYEFISKKLEKFGFLPKFLGRYGKNVFYEYIEGRDFRKNEVAKKFEDLRRIAAYVNSLKTNKNPERHFMLLLKQLNTGKFQTTDKIERRKMLDKKFGIKRNIYNKSLFSNKKTKNIKDIFVELKKDLKPETTLDVHGILPGNFRVTKNQKVYFVDIDAIKFSYRGFGIIICFDRFGKKKDKIKFFEKGYSSVSSFDFFTEKYEDFLSIYFLISKINVACQTGKNYKDDIKKLNGLLQKYKK